MVFVMDCVIKKQQHYLNYYEKTRKAGFGKEVKARIMIGNYVLSVGHAGEFYNNAKIAQHRMRQEFEEMFRHVDVLVMPNHADNGI